MPTSISRLFHRTNVAPAGPAPARREPQEAWHVALTPEHQIAGAFKSDGMFGKLPRAHRKGIEKCAHDLLTQPMDPPTVRRMLAYMSNDRRLAADDDGTSSARSCGLVWRLLHAETANLMDESEQAAMHQVLRDYKTLFLSAATNHYFRTNPHADRAAYAAQAPHMVANGLTSRSPGLLLTGFKGHATVTRVAMLDGVRATGVPAGSTMATYRRDVQRALGAHASEWLACCYQLHMNAEDFKSPIVQRLITANDALVHPGDAADHVRVTTRSDGGRLQTQEIPVPQLETYLRDRNLRPIANGLKATIHNGGSGARFNRGDVRTYDFRLTIPLHRATQALTTLQCAKLMPKEQAARALASLIEFDADHLHSMQRSPVMALQDLGNCTVHSQMLGLLYELQHLREFGDTSALDERQGTQLFTRLWSQAYERVRRACEDPDLRARAKQAGEAMRADMATMLAPSPMRGQAQQPGGLRHVELLRQAGAPRRAPAPRPARPTVPTPARRLRAETNFPAMERSTAQPGAHADLAAWGQSNTPPPDSLVAWMHSIRGSAWAPRHAGEAVAFTKLHEHIMKNAPTGEANAHRDWLNAMAYRSDINAIAKSFLNDPRADSPHLPALGAYLFAMQYDPHVANMAGPLTPMHALAVGRHHDPLLAHISRGQQQILDQIEKFARK